MFPEHPHSIAALLAPPYDAQVEAIWHHLQQRLDLEPRFATPVPHLSFHVAAGYDEARLAISLRDLASRHTPLCVRTAGLGIFTGPQPFLVLMVVRTAALSALHHALFEAVQGIAETPSPYYTPETWVPHITLNPGPLNPAQLIEAVSILSADAYSWELTLDNIALICDNCGSQGIHYRFNLNPSLTEVP